MSSQIRIPESKGSVPAADTAPSMPQPQIADPGPLGLAGFAMTTFVLSVFNTGMLTASVAATVLPLALFYGGLAQLLAGMWEFRKANTFGALAFTSFGAFWLSYAAFARFVAPGLTTQANKAVGLYLLGWAIFTTYMIIAAMRTNLAVLAVFVALAVTFIILTIGAFADKSGITKAGGWVGLVTAALAWYASCAGVTNGTWGRTIMPTFPLNDGMIMRARGRREAVPPAQPVS